MSVSKAKEYAVLYLNQQGVKTNEISNELNLKEETVEKILNEHASNNDNEQTGSKKSSKAHNLMIRETSGKKTNNVSIMTKEASMLIDEQLKNQQNTPKHRGIFRPK
jgi:orotate phosphoribosyltransferase-like protein